MTTSKELHKAQLDFRHTPGPWVCYADLPSVDPNWHIVTNASRMRVLANVHIEPGNAVDEANARLITAAPELLAACRYIVEAGENGDEVTAIAKARAAIAKATGIEPVT